MADIETASETPGAPDAATTPTPVRKPRKPRTPKAPVETAETEVLEKPKVTRTRKPRVAPAAKVEAKEEGLPWAFGSDDKAPVEEVTPPVVPVPVAVAPVVVESEPEVIPAPETSEKTKEEPVTEKLEDLNGEEGGALTLEDLFGPQPEDTEAEDRAAEEQAATELADEVYANASEKVLYATNGTIVAPGYWQAWPGKGGRINVFAWLGIVAAFVFFPLGLLFSGLGWVNAKGVADDKFSRILSGVGFGISAFFAFMILIPLAFGLLFGILSLLWAPFMW